MKIKSTCNECRTGEKMGYYEKLFMKWLQQTPTMASKKDVIGLIDRFGLQYRTPGGSHLVIEDARLAEFVLEHPEYPDLFHQTLSIPIRGGTEVKGYYIKRLVSFLRYLQEQEGFKNDLSN